jgi:hypothetical protein
MRDLLGAALGIAREHSARAGLVRIFGACLDAEGRVDVDRTDSYLARWEFAFHDPGEGVMLSVAWLGAAYEGVRRPHVDVRPGNVPADLPRIELADYGVDAELLPDSPEVARVIAASGLAWSGGDGDFLVYTRANEDVVDAVAGQSRIWRGRMEDLAVLHVTPAD